MTAPGAPRAEGPAGDEAPTAPAGRRPVPWSSLAVAAWAVALAFAAAGAARGLPGLERALVDARGRPRLEVPCLGPALDRRLPDRGRVVLARPRRLADGQEVMLTQHASLGGELAAVLVHGALLAALWAWLRRPGPDGAPRARLAPDRRDLERAAGVLAVAGPTLALVGVVGARVAAGVDGGAPLREAVWLLPPALLARPGAAAVVVVHLVVVAPLVEEALWRGVVYPRLRRALPFGPASVLCALLFGAWHAATGWTEPVALAVQYGFGLLACALVEGRPGRLGAPVAVHAVGNACALALFAACLRAPEAVLALFGLPDRPVAAY